MARKNKTKKEIVHDIKDVQEADRKRKIVREVIYPFLLELNDTIGYTKVFLQTASTGLENAFQEKQREMKVSEFIPRMKEVFVDKGNEAVMAKYMKLFELLKDESIFSFITMIQYMPRAIDSLFTQKNDKRPVIDLNITDVLG